MLLWIPFANVIMVGSINKEKATIANGLMELFFIP